jgi:hypothetical protein
MTGWDTTHSRHAVGYGLVCYSGGEMKRKIDRVKK